MMFMIGKVKPRSGTTRSGVAAMEFALISPVMAIFLFGFVDITQALITYRRVTTVAQQTAEMVTEMAENPDATEAAVVPPHTAALSVTQLDAASSMIFSVFPYLRDAVIAHAATPPFSVTVSEINFIGLPAGCTAGLDCISYTADLAWSVPLKTGQRIVRSCGQVAQVPPTTSPSGANITSGGMTALQTAIMVDVTYIYRPIFGVFLHGNLGTLAFTRHAFAPPRNFPAPYIIYDTYGNSNLCGNYQ